MPALLDQPTTRPTTREVIAAATSTTHVFDEPVAAARYELFRRALVEKDEEAWNALYHAYECLLASWINKQLTIGVEDYCSLVDQIWMRLLSNIRTPDKFSQFANLGAVLAYLKCCTLSACVDYIREQHRCKQHLSFETLQQDDSVALASEEIRLTTDYQDLLDLLAPLLRTEQERLIVEVLLIQEEKTATLLKRYPHLFSSITDIYWKRRRLVERLRRNKDVQAAKEDL